MQRSVEPKRSSTVETTARAMIDRDLGIGASGTIYFSSDIENAIYKVTKK